MVSVGTTCAGPVPCLVRTSITEVAPFMRSGRREAVIRLDRCPRGRPALLRQVWYATMRGDEEDAPGGSRVQPSSRSAA